MGSPHPKIPSHLPPHPVPLCCPRAMALGALLHASNSHWSSVLYIYMFQCYSLKSSQALLPLLSPKVCSLCLCLLCCPACRTVRIIFLNSICMSLYTVFVFLFLTYFTLFKYKDSRFIHLIRTDSNAILLYS